MWPTPYPDLAALGTELGWVLAAVLLPRAQGHDWQTNHPGHLHLSRRQPLHMQSRGSKMRQVPRILITRYGGQDDPMAVCCGWVFVRLPYGNTAPGVLFAPMVHEEAGKRTRCRSTEGKVCGLNTIAKV
jgi:hypothetical protein